MLEEEDMDSGDRISAVHQAFQLCTSREQVQVLGELTAYHKRDFLTLLPPSLARATQSHLRID